jgi:glycosyltransferase 2 family protein
MARSIISGLRPALAVRIAITAGVLWYLIELAPLGQVAEALAAANVALVVAGFAAQVAVRFINASRIRIIARAQGAPLSYRAILAALFTTAFYGLMLPGSIGAGAATLVKYVGHGATVSAALASMIVNRLLDTCTTIALGMFFWGLDRYGSVTPSLQYLAIALLVAGPLLLVALHLSLFGRVRLLQRLAHTSRRLDLAQRGALARGVANVLDQCEAAAALPPIAAVSVGLLSLVKDLLAALAVYCFARACGISLDYITIAWMQAAVALLVLLPITVSGLGVREGALVFFGTQNGIAAPTALGWSLLIFTGTLFIAAIGGAYEARAAWRSSSRS